MLKNFFKKINTEEHKIKKERFEVNAYLFWDFILIFASILFILSILFGYYYFLSFDKEDKILNINTQVENTIINKEKLNNEIKYFKEKEAKSESIIQTPSFILNPSI